jgi:DNA-binding MarR family transcriptional regulator
VAAANAALSGRALYPGTMPDLQAPQLSLSEWLVLSLICEKPTHGFAIARMLGPGGSLGQVWRVPKSVIYRAMQRLEMLGLVRTAGEQDSSRGRPARCPRPPRPGGGPQRRG